MGLHPYLLFGDKNSRYGGESRPDQYICRENSALSGRIEALVCLPLHSQAKQPLRPKHFSGQGGSARAAPSHVAQLIASVGETPNHPSLWEHEGNTLADVDRWSLKPRKVSTNGSRRIDTEGREDHHCGELW